MTGKKSVLLITSAHPALGDLFIRSLYQPPVVEKSAAQAKIRLQKQTFDLIVIQTPTADEFGIQSAIDIASRTRQPVLLLVSPEIYDQACYQVRDAMVFVLSLPANKNLLIQAVSFVERAGAQVKDLENRLLKEKQKARDEKVVTRCKLMLIEQYHWSEEKAHHYIEKLAMNHSLSRVMVAKTLLNKMEQKLNGKSA